MKKIFVEMLAVMSLFFIFPSCKQEPPEEYKDVDTSQYEETVIWEGSKKISGWWSSNDVILEIPPIESKEIPEVNSVLISYKSQRNPSFKITEKPDTGGWKNAMVEVVRGNGSLVDDIGDGSTIELTPNKEYGTVLCKVSKETMENFIKNGFNIYGDAFTVSKVSLTNDTSDEPGNVGHENPSKPPKELPNDIVVWDDGANFVKDGSTINVNFKNVENYSSNANAIRISFSTENIANDGTEWAGFYVSPLYYDEDLQTNSIGVPNCEYSIGDGYLKSTGNDDTCPYITLNGKAKNGAIVLKIPDVYLQNYIKNGLSINGMGNNRDFTISKVSLTRLEEKTVFEGSQALSWDYESEQKLDIDPGKISADAKSILIYFKRTYEINDDASCLAFKCRADKKGYNNMSVYAASGCGAFNFIFDDIEGKDMLYLNKSDETGISSCVFPSDDIKDFNKRGILLLGQDVIITKVAYMYFSETGPTPNADPTPAE